MAYNKLNTQTYMYIIPISNNLDKFMNTCSCQYPNLNNNIQEQQQNQNINSLLTEILSSFTY